VPQFKGMTTWKWFKGLYQKNWDF